VFTSDFCILVTTSLGISSHFCRR